MGSNGTPWVEASPVMTLAEVCGYLNIHKSKLYRLIKRQGIPYFTLGRHYRFNREEIERWRKTFSEGIEL
jgi:excisionase family DNA binding protein